MLWEVYTDKVAAGLPRAFDLIFLGEIPAGLMILNNMRRPNTFTNVVAFTGLSREYNSRKPAFLICKNTVADQLHGNRAANQRLCFHYIVQSLYFLNLKFQASCHLLWLYSRVCVGPQTPKTRFLMTWLRYPYSS